VRILRKRHVCNYLGNDSISTISYAEIDALIKEAVPVDCDFAGGSGVVFTAEDAKVAKRKAEPLYRGSTLINADQESQLQRTRKITKEEGAAFLQRLFRSV